MGNYRFGAEEGEDSLFTNVELVVGALSSILRNSNLKKADALCVEEALALSLKGVASVCPSAFSYLSHSCLLLSANSILFLGKWLLIQRAWRGGQFGRDLC